jgi:MFS family permease
VNAITLLLYANLAGLSFFLPMFLIQVRGFSATAAGAATLPLVIFLFVASGWSGRLYDRVGPRLPIAGGAFITGVAFALFVLLAKAPGFLLAVTLPMTVMGAGMALLVAPLTTTVMAAAPDALAGTASGINNAVSRVAGLLAIGILGAVMLATFAGRLNQELSAGTLPGETKTELLASVSDLAGMKLPASLTESQAAEARTAINESFTAGFSRILSGMALLAALGGGLALVTLPGREVPVRSQA